MRYCKITRGRLERLRESLAPKARVGIIDRNGNGEDHGQAEKIVVDEARQAGYKLLGSYDFVKADGLLPGFLNRARARTTRHYQAIKSQR